MKELRKELPKYRALAKSTLMSTKEVILSGKKNLPEGFWRSFMAPLESKIVSVLQRLIIDDPDEVDSSDLVICASIINRISKNWEEHFVWRRNEASLTSPQELREVLHTFREVQFNIYILSAWLRYDKELRYWENHFLAKKEQQERVDKNYYG